MLQAHHLLFACLLFSGVSHATAQAVTAPGAGDTGPLDSIHVKVDVSPSFQGGDARLHKYLSDSIRYPEAARTDSVQGTVFIAFVVEADGRVTNPKVERGIGGGCDEEALRAVSAMPRWNPGMHKGKRVRVGHTLPVKFTTREAVNPTASMDAAFSVVEEMPSFPGGEAEMGAFLKANLHYPADAIEKGIGGDVYTTFEVDTDGSIKDMKVLHGVYPSIDAEALRMLSIMPRWNPGTQNGRLVRVQITLPMRFSLR